MKTMYKVTITETLEEEVEVEASSRDEAKRLVDEQWRNSDHILDSDNYAGVTFTVQRPKNRDYER
jgi:hypothetical protein